MELALLSICYGQAVITTVAGNGSTVYFGDKLDLTRLRAHFGDSGEAER